MPSIYVPAALCFCFCATIQRHTDQKTCNSNSFTAVPVTPPAVVSPYCCSSTPPPGETTAFELAQELTIARELHAVLRHYLHSIITNSLCIAVSTRGIVFCWLLQRQGRKRSVILAAAWRHTRLQQTPVRIHQAARQHWHASVCCCSCCCLVHTKAPPASWKQWVPKAA